MRWWSLKNVFDEKSIEFSNLPNDDELAHSKESHVAAARV